jgi:hypothetical protein
MAPPLVADEPTKCEVEVDFKFIKLRYSCSQLPAFLGGKQDSPFRDVIDKLIFYKETKATAPSENPSVFIPVGRQEFDYKNQGRKALTGLGALLRNQDPPLGETPANDASGLAGNQPCTTSLTYVFREEVTVAGFGMWPHSNGLTAIRVNNEKDGWLSSEAGDITQPGLPKLKEQTIHHFIINPVKARDITIHFTKTYLANGGYAIARLFPFDDSGKKLRPSNVA